MLSIPETSIGYWRSRLIDYGFSVEESEVFGEKRLDFHPPLRYRVRTRRGRFR
jgi:hypothetical protein